MVRLTGLCGCVLSASLFCSQLGLGSALVRHRSVETREDDKAPDSGQLVQVMRHLSQVAGSGQIHELADRLDQLKAEFFEQDEDLLNAHQREGLAYNTALLLPLQIAQVKQILYRLDNARVFWSKSFDSKIPYFFRVSPRKWLSKNAERVLATGHIRDINRYFDIYAAYLGELFEAFRAFASVPSPSLGLGWTVSTLKLLKQPFGQKACPNVATEEGAFQCGIQLCGLIPRLADLDAKRLLRGKQFSTLERNWFPYLLGTAAALTSAFLLYKYLGSIIEAGDKVRGAGKNRLAHAHQAVRSVFGADRTLRFGTGDDVTEVTLKGVDFMEIADATVNMRPAQISALIEKCHETRAKLPKEGDGCEKAVDARRNLKERIRVLTAIRDHQTQLLEGLGQFTGSERDREARRLELQGKLNEWLAEKGIVKNMGVTIRQQIIDRRLDRSRELGLNDVSAEQIGADIDAQVKSLNMGLVNEAISIRRNLNLHQWGDFTFLGDLKTYLGIVNFGVSSAVQGGMGLGGILGHRMAQDVNLIVRQQRWVLALLALAPITAVAIAGKFAISKIKGWFQGKSRSRLQQRLSALTAVLFSTSDKQMTPLVRGKIIYQADQLEKVEKSVRGEVRREFRNVLSRLPLLDDMSALRDMIFYLSSTVAR